MIQLSTNIVIETQWSGANVGCVITSEGLILIDTPHAISNGLTWKKEVESRGVVRYLINTEAHDDHYAGNFLFDVPVIAHAKTREAMSKADTKKIIEGISQKDPDLASIAQQFKLKLPSLTFSQDATLYSGEHSFNLIHLQGHSPCMIAIHIPEERVVFTGDNVTCGIQGFLHEADPFAWLDSLKKLEKLDVDHLIPGHGDPCDKSFLKDEAGFVSDCIAKIEDALQKGWSKEETIERVSFVHFPLDGVLEEFGQVLLEWSVSNMYDVISTRK